MDHPLRAHRKECGLTQVQLAQRSGVSIRTILSIEKRNRRPLYPTRRKLLRALGLPWSMQRAMFGPPPGKPDAHK